MSNLSDIGNLMYLDLEIIEPGEIAKTPEYLITATAKELHNTDGRNWIPLVVKELAEDSYQVIGNSFIYAVAEAAGLEKVWCIIADDSEQTAKVTKMLAGEEIPKINLSTASRDEIKSALEYLIEQPDTVLKRVKLPVATNRIDESPRQYWQDLKPITKLKCGITAGKKIKALEKVFYLTPESMPDDIKDPKILNTLTITELRKLARQRKLKKYSRLTKSKLVNLLSH
ncbi:Rho termination factor [Xenococcus sp. PCC 7305]|uniref:Rho termination factor n=1 Tax=Xenococcus sp. PCC 7305 TaxID=102125 RepID=UPI0002AC399F|nr:Rho termination factor [Xenococcus sp. PCC 7305]ELS02956.1 Rho termination factor [Xenococcus sp. PCC 7305]